MYTCKNCGKPNCKNELCFKCNVKLNGPAPKSPCTYCGKIARGKICKDCRIKYAIKNQKQYCEMCGKQLTLSYNPERKHCVKCANILTRMKDVERNKQNSIRVCKFCGKEFKQKETLSPSEYRTFCSLKCASKFGHEIRNHNKENFEMKILNYIKSQDTYVTLPHLKNALKLTNKQLETYDVDIVQLNKQCGYEINNDYIITNNKRSEVKNIKINTTCERAIILKNEIIQWLREQGHFTPIRSILKHFHIDFYTTWKRYGFDNYLLHKEAGIPYSRNISWAEYRAADICKEYFGEDDVVTQKRFSGLKSDKGWGLRFDIYIKSINSIIEIDGEQHYNKNHIYSHDHNDIKKEQYAKDNNIALYRIRIKPSNDFEERVHDLCKKLGVLKES